MIRRRNTKKSRAASILEFVLVLPFFLLLMMLVVDLGRVMMVHTEVNSALNAAARTAAVQGGARDNAKALFVQEYNTTAGVDGTNIGVEALTGKTCTSSDSHVTLKAEFTINLNTPFLEALVSAAAGEFSVDTTAIARCEIISSLSS